MWWQQGVIYQIYPRSFQDSNGDGIGDLPGLISRLDYLNDGTADSLGVDALWLSPFFPSPMQDFGYDISDYCAIDPLFGSMEDFTRLISAAHQRGIRIILDLVMNHTSDQHPWFRNSCHPGSEQADWYIWHEGRRPPNNWLGCLGGGGWSFSKQRQAWYFHSFLPQQPDLNWRNPQVKQAVKDIMAFWLDKGVDGFRLDVVNLYFKDKALRNNPQRWFFPGRPYDRQHHRYDRDQPEMHALLRELRQWVDRWPERMMVGEIMLEPGKHSDLPASYYGAGDELHLAFNFEFFHTRFSARSFRRVIERWSWLLGEHNWPNHTLSNHDFMRHASRFRGTEQPQRLRLLALLLLTLRGTPFLYYGEETGMPEQPVRRRDLQDPAGKRYWPLHPGRDGCRRPMMWSAQPQDFSAGHSWLPNEPLASASVAAQQHDPDSLLNWYKQLIHTRKNTPALHSGQQRLLSAPDAVLAYQRGDSNSGQCCTVLLNFSSRPQNSGLPRSSGQSVLLNSQPQHAPAEAGEILLQPLQGLVLCQSR